MIRAADVPGSERARVVYLSASAIGTALRARGATDGRLYSSHVTLLALWAGLSRGNLLALMRLLLELIDANDVAGDRLTDRGTLRFRAARGCLKASMDAATLLPKGPVCGIPPVI